MNGNELTSSTIKARELDPGCKKILDELAKFGKAELCNENIQAARQGMKLLTKVSRLCSVFSVCDDLVKTENGEVPVRIYRPSEQADLPVVVFCHGGGWVLCDLDTHDDVARQIATASNCVVVSVDYRLSPEHKFPAAVDDVYQVLGWVHVNANALAVDRNRIALIGDSAGGNLAAVAALKSKDVKGPNIYFQCLLYPVIDLQHANTASYSEFEDKLNLRMSDMMFFKQAYLADHTLAAHPYVSPICHEDLSGLPESYIVSAGYDVLRDDAKNYAVKLIGYGNKVTYQEFSSLIHGFLGMTEKIPAAKKAMEEICQVIKNKLHSIQ